jgi:hypothetical protein
VWELTGSQFEGMSDVLRNAAINGSSRSVEVVVVMDSPGRMTGGGGGIASLQSQLLCNHFIHQH